MITLKLRRISNPKHHDVKCPLHAHQSSINHFQQRTRDPTTIKLYRTKVVTGTQRNFFKPEYGMNLVKRGGFAFHLDSATGYKIMRKSFSEREICDIQEIELFPPQGMAAVMKQGTPYKELFAYGFVSFAVCFRLNGLIVLWN